MIDTRDYSYASEVEVRSPDGKYLASVTDAEEYAMSSETYGTLTITGESSGYPFRHVFEHCNPNILWSDDSKVLAVPRRDPKKGLCLMLVSVPRGHWGYDRGGFGLLQLQSFAGGVIRGVDGRMKFEIDVSEVSFPFFPEGD